ncbi:MDR family MFS transporter [Glycomyces algeriensis]|uniref:MFS transporter n=1 Tax=Glycomyces algeriensis TaxID=256037 RepID=A0A9W6GAN5_9ACTN|nr:MDR family MFS transporter [Glycomyces algeriensis]MDA1368839.1 MDR family MFS transporter [Glycomyces algeriensis]MDR7350855.1 EmrB/QacA subfamily drug resistance transporter [Glycomyces algeriensis]GLI43566.1 MFS transporter [Glycomyces algeriensis]
MATVDTPERADPAEPAPPVLGKSRRNLVFATIMLGMLMAALDQTIVSTALPTIVADLGSPGHMAWVVTSYLLAEAIAAAVVGKFGDMFGRKAIFQISAVVFVGGSALAGFSDGMVFLIVSRAVQGLGAGGLMVTAMALIADVIPLRDRGKYQGAMGAVFGVTTVLGPTLGGLFTDHLSWRWCFYVNLPIAVVMIAMAAATIPRVRSVVKPVIDYLGLILVAVGTTLLILALEWGGDEYAWDSGVILGMFAGAGVAILLFIVVERRAAEPILPMALFANPVFTVSSILSFIVGFAMLGAMTFLPTYLQYVDGTSATVSGYRTLPMVAGMMVCSILSGSVVSRTGRYKIFPILGTFIMGVGLYLMSTMGTDTSIWLESLYMLVFGSGLGLAMQVLTIAVQNTVPYAQMGAATSGVTFFRTIGSTFGTAIFGTLFTNHSTPLLAAAYAESGVDPAVAASPAALHELPDAVIAPIIQAYADSIDFVFFWTVPVAAVGFVVAWFLVERPLHDATRGRAADMGEGFGAPDPAPSEERLARMIADVMQRERETVFTEVYKATDTLLDRADAWAMRQVYVLERAGEGASVRKIAAAHRVPPEVLMPVFTQAVRSGLLAVDTGRLHLTPLGRAEFERFIAVWRRWLDAHLDDWDLADPEDRKVFDKAVTRIARAITTEESQDWNEPAALRS